MITPDYIAHADWGTDPKKRQVAGARKLTGGGYEVASLAPAKSIDAMGGDLRAGLHVPLRNEGQFLAGFDLPIGLPRGYAQKAGIDSFPGFLPKIGREQFEHFALVAASPGEISLNQPFYPARPGGTSQAHLYDGLGLTRRQLRRRCDGNDAETMFWTLGGKQVGKAALAGWEYLSAASLNKIRLWPFDGRLSDLLDGDPNRIVVTETYPREFYQYFRFGSRGSGSKRNREDRLQWIPDLIQWASTVGVSWQPEILSVVQAGFSDGVNGEDEFDAVVGLIGMIAVVIGSIEEGQPTDDAAVVKTEGWMLGRSSDVADGVHLTALVEPQSEMRPLSRESLQRSEATARINAPESNGICLCGCGATVRRRFLPGHDAKLKSRLMREHVAGDVTATLRLAEFGWL